MLIEVQPYNKKWPVYFQKIKNNLENHINAPYVSIEHIGSTSVPGLYAKPKIDIDVIVKTNQEKPAVIHDVNLIGYKHIGDLGITGREAFRYFGTTISLPEHNLYLIEETNIAWLNHKYLREHLRKYEDAKIAYSALKRSLAKKFPNDINAYIDGKTAFILDILEKSNMPEDKLQIIKMQNKMP